jgi:DNA-binding transcriptional LysR family regulator
MFGRLHVAPVVLDFLAAYPDITARLLLADHVVNLVDEHVDVAVRVGPLPDSLLMATRIGAVSWVTCASPRYLHARGTPETPAGLEGHDCIMFEGLYSTNLWRFATGKTTVAVAIRPRLTVNTADAAIAAAIASAGITRVLSYQVQAAVAAGALRLILRPHEPEPLPVHAVYAGQSLLPLKLRVPRGAPDGAARAYIFPVDRHRASRWLAPSGSWCASGRTWPAVPGSARRTARL